MDTVSVIIPTFNQAEYIEDAVQSVISQDYPELEIIVVDDGSTDDTAGKVKSFRDPRLRYIYQRNRGLSAARNTGIKNSHGAYVSFLDSDDLFLRSKLSILIQAFEEHPDADIAAGQAVPIDEKGNRAGKIFNKPLPANNPAELLLGNPLHVGSVMIRSSRFMRIGLFDENLHSYEDWDMWLRLTLSGSKSIWVPKPVSLYRFHRDQMTRIGKQMTVATFSVLDKFFSQSELPEGWLLLKEKAYSRAHLRAAAQAYHAREFDLAVRQIRSAVSLDPVLCENNANMLTKHIQAWTELPKIENPVDFIKLIYKHLPPELKISAKRKREHIGQVAAQSAFNFLADGVFVNARKLAIRAFKENPALLANRGLLAIICRSITR